MSTLVVENKTCQFERNRFKRLLAQYRAKVYESTYEGINRPEVAMEEVIHNNLNKPSILVIEDNPDDWFLTRYGLLRQFPEAQCHWLAEEAGVLAYLNQWTTGEKELPRLILVDLYLPTAQTGIRVIEMLKAHPLYKTIPTVVLSRSADPADMSSVFSLQVNAYVIKPTEPTEWLTVFRKLEPYWESAKLGNTPTSAS